MYDPRYWCEQDNTKYRAYVDKMVVFAKWLINNKYPVFLFGTQIRDEYVIDDIIKELGELGNIDGIRRKSESVYELMNIFTSADIVVATRFHGTVLSLLSERPVLGVCYYRKSMDLLADMDQKRFSVMLDTFDPDDLIDRFKVLEQCYPDESAKIRTHSENYKSKLDEQYDLLFRKFQV